MTENKKITMWIEWSDEDTAFIGQCPQFFPYGAVCHGHTEARAIDKLAAIVRDELGEQNSSTHARLSRLKVFYMIPRGGTFNTHQKSCDLTLRDGSYSANFRNTLLTKPFGLS